MSEGAEEPVVRPRMVAPGVDVRGIRRVDGPAFRWRVHYDASGRRETLDARRDRSVRTPPEHDAGHAGPDALFLGSTVPRVQQAVREAVVVKAGARGARVYAREGSEPSPVPARPVAPTVDPTGAGDALAGGLVGVLAARVAGGGSWQAGLGEGVREGVRTGAVAVWTFSVEALLQVAEAGAAVALEGEG